MRLVRGGRIVADQYVRVLTDAPIPDGVPVIVPATRFIADAAEIARREAPTGVLWPNNRRIAELAPHLDRLALVALEFPSFKDGRGYSQARLLRAGFDAFEVVKDADAAVFAEAVARYSVFYQPAGDRRIPALRARLEQPRTLAACERV